MIRIRAFRAVNDPETCERYLEGHVKVLTDYNITQITTNNKSWFGNPLVFGIIVEDVTSGKPLGGARIHVSGGSQNLPVEDAVCYMDPKICNIVRNYGPFKTGELCGLWTDRDVAGMGYSVLLTRAGVARASAVIAKFLELQSLFVLCGPYTLDLAKNAGFIREKTIGDKGQFVYPRPDLLATVMIIKDMTKLSSASPVERTKIFDLRDKPKQTNIEEGPKGSIMIEYDLELKGLGKLNEELKNRDWDQNK